MLALVLFLHMGVVVVRHRINNQTLLFVHDCVRTLVVCWVLSLALGTAKSKRSKTLNSGYLGSRNDEERSEMRYVM